MLWRPLNRANVCNRTATLRWRQVTTWSSTLTWNITLRAASLSLFLSLLSARLNVSSGTRIPRLRASTNMRGGTSNCINRWPESIKHAQIKRRTHLPCAVGLIFLCGSRGVMESPRFSQIRGDGQTHPRDSSKLCNGSQNADKGRRRSRGTRFCLTMSAAQKTATNPCLLAHWWERLWDGKGRRTPTI